MEVTYRVQRGDAWRETIYTYTHHPQMMALSMYLIFILLLVVTPNLTKGDILAALWAGLWYGVFMSSAALAAINLYEDALETYGAVSHGQGGATWI